METPRVSCDMCEKDYKTRATMRNHFNRKHKNNDDKVNNTKVSHDKAQAEIIDVEDDDFPEDNVIMEVVEDLEIVETAEEAENGITMKNFFISPTTHEDIDPLEPVTLVCMRCHKEFPGDDQLNQHITSHHLPLLTWHCTLCAFTTNQLVVLESHVKYDHTAIPTVPTPSLPTPTTSPTTTNLIASQRIVFPENVDELLGDLEQEEEQEQEEEVLSTLYPNISQDLSSLLDPPPSLPPPSPLEGEPQCELVSLRPLQAPSNPPTLPPSLPTLEEHTQLSTLHYWSDPYASTCPPARSESPAHSDPPPPASLTLPQQLELAYQSLDYMLAHLRSVQEAIRCQPQGIILPSFQPTPVPQPSPVPQPTPVPQPAPVPKPTPVIKPLFPPQKPKQSETWACPQCKFKSNSLATLDSHLDTKHSSPKKEKEVTLMIGDSTMKTVNGRVVERALGGGGLVTGRSAASSSRRSPRAGHPGRAYNSAPNWPGSVFPQSSFQDVVPRLLARGKYRNLVLQSPTSDITNLWGVPQEHLHRGYVLQSAKNMVATAERALAHTPDLRKVVILDMLPREDHLLLASHAAFFNSTLRELVAASPLHSQIHVGNHSTLTPSTEAKKVAIFGPSSRSDGIHFKGPEGTKRHTSSVVAALQSAGLAPPSSQLAATAQGSSWTTQGRRGAARVQPSGSSSQPPMTTNSWQVLNC